MDNTICTKLDKIKTRISHACEKAGRNPEDILLIAVSKTKTNRAILEALDCGQIHFGENRARELQEKMEQIDRPEIRWHFVGPMQTNKIKYLVGRTDWIQSVYKKKYLDEIEKRLDGTGRIINALIQVNISGEDQKQGCPPDKVGDLLRHAQSLQHVRVRGVMGMATYTDDMVAVRKEFKLLKETSDANLHLSGGSVSMDHLSMGMSHDMETAIEEGATMVRIGTAIFGERNYG